jgi:hypothetical protein
MNPALKELWPAIVTWPDEDQQALAEAAREIQALRGGIYGMSSDEAAAVAEGLSQADRNEFAEDARIRALWERAGL